jgi:hypothetical protein
MVSPPLNVADLSFDDRRRLCESRDSVVLYLETRGLAGLTLPCSIDYFRRDLRDKGGPRTRGVKLTLRVAFVVLRQFAAVARHVPAVLAMSLWQALTKTAMQTLRTTPVTLAAMILLFLTSDAWKICGNENVEQVVVIIGAVLAISVIFFFAGSASQFGSWTSEVIPDPRTDNISELAETITQAKDLVRPEIAPDTGKLSYFQILNVRAVYIVLIVVNFLAVGFWAAAALFFFGILLFSSSAQAELMGGKDQLHPLVVNSIAGYPVAITSQLILVSVMLAGIAVLSFAATGLQDPEARKAFVRQNVQDLKSCVSAFYFYRAAANLIGAGDGGDER